MKFGSNRPRSQPNFGLFASKPFACVYPATRPLQRPALAQLDGPPEYQVRWGKTTMCLMFLPTFRWKRVKAGCQRFYRRR